MSFEQGSTEWRMFTNLWNLCKKYWEVREDDAYWEALVADASRFIEAYKDDGKVGIISKSLCMAVLSGFEDISRRNKNGNKEG